MKRLVFIVEGDTEVLFINSSVIPYLYNLGFKNPMNAQTIITNRKQHKKGGVVNYQYLKNDISRVLAQENVIITTFIDFFRLPTNFPNYTTNSELIQQIENGISNDFDDNSDIIPYIQRHEIESLMFSEIDGFDFVIDEERKLKEIENIIIAYPNPEDINSRPEKAPSKRLEKIFNYDKVIDSEMIFDFLAIEQIMDKCPRFKIWIEKLILKLSE
jgi:hypothetical protein